MFVKIATLLFSALMVIPIVLGTVLSELINLIYFSTAAGAYSGPGKLSADVLPPDRRDINDFGISQTSVVTSRPFERGWQAA